MFLFVSQGRMMYFTSPVGSPAVMYVFWGALEFGVNLLYIIDCLVYRPDRLQMLEMF